MSVKRYQEMLNEIRDLFESDAEALNMLETIEQKIEHLPEEKLKAKADRLKNNGKKKKVLAKDFQPPEEITKFANTEAMALFCDGACRGNPGPGAWAALGQLPSGEIFFEASGVELSTTNNRMELTGAISSLHAVYNYIEEKKWGQSPQVFVYSDSKYVVEGVNSWIAQWKSRGWKKGDNKAPENLDLWQELDQLVQGLSKLKFVWVKGHQGHPQNEFVDHLCNMALDESGF